MRTSTALSGFALAAAVVFAGAYGIGAAAGPTGIESTADDAGGGHRQVPGGADVAAAPQVGGLTVAQDGYRFEPVGAPPTAGTAGEFAFRIVDDAGVPVTGFTETHDKRLHLIVASRDLTEFQHLHPRMSPDGTWRTTLTLPTAGDYRAFADFAPEGAEQGVTLGHDLSVAGAYRPRPMPEPATVATVDGYEVRLRGDLVPGRTSRLTLAVYRDGRPVSDLQPYLAAYGHLVALRDGDLAYLHVHPDGEPGDGRTRPGPEIVFYAEVPSAGTYRLFLDFQHRGEVRTAAFTATAGAPAPAPGARPDQPDQATVPDDPSAGHGDEPSGHGH